MNNIKRSLVINVLIIVVCLTLFKSVSYSAKVDPTKDNKDLLIKTGNMQVVLNIPNEKYELISSLENDGNYQFSITNTGNIPIEYYEIRLVDQEGKVSTLPHKYLNFTISCDNKIDDSIKNLGDSDSIIYAGYDLGVGDSSSFDLKMWVNEGVLDASLKELYGAIEVTLYQKYDVYKNYVLYESMDSTNVPVRTSIYNPISSVIPKKDGYNFVGWQGKNSDIIYYPGDTYREKTGTTLYAIWEKV